MLVPAETLKQPGIRKPPPCTRSSLMRRSVQQYMNIEEPICIMVSPWLITPTLMDSDEESPLPVITGVPSARPVRAAASAVILPARSVTTWPRGSWSGRQ